MDFITKLPKTSSGYGTIWEIVDHLAKPVLLDNERSRYKGGLTRRYLKEVVSRHGVPDKLYVVEEPMEIRNREVKQLKQSCILIVKDQWNSRRGLEFTWEREDQFRSKYLHLFVNTTPKDNQN
nr:putative reverse transcriptase domain-containing protein [Tanacetum cinerariifolium]